jgi:hypothetical protein
LSFNHTLYGLRFTTNVAIPGLRVSARAPANPDLMVHLKPASHSFDWGSGETELIYSSSSQFSEAEPSLQVMSVKRGAFICFFYRDGARFAIRADGSELWADWPEGYSLEDAATYLVGPVMGYVLRLKGVTPLHASAIEIEERAIAIVGAPGAGKSTTAAAFAHMGHGVLSDDVAAVRERSAEFEVAPGYPRVNLWPDSVHALHGSEDALPLITPGWGKRYVPLGQHGRFESRCLTLGAIYFLGARDTSRSTPVIEAVAPADALVSLVANTYVNYVLNRDMRHREFDVLSKIVSAIPIRRILPCTNSSRVIEMCEAIAADAHSLLPSVADATSGAK